MTTLGQGFPGNEVVETAIPDDVMREAMRIKSECNVDFGGGIGGGAIIRMIADGILAERERCASIADEHASQCRSKLHKKRSDHDLAVFESAASEAASIADAIRKGGAA